MPYSPSQLRCLEGMGMVPWVSRAYLPADDAVELANAIAQTEQVLAPAPEIPEPVATPNEVAVAMSAVPVPNVNQEPVDLMDTVLVEIPFRGQRCTQLGKADAPLLILVEAVSTAQKQYPFEPADAKIFEDMLRAIAWRRQDVCLGVLPPAAQSSLLEQTGPCVRDLCQPHRDAVLMFKQHLPESIDANDLVVPLERPGMMAWQLPHPSLLRESPNRKRQAWNVLKAARARLG